METEIREEGEELLFPENLDSGNVFFFGFECNNCGDMWFSTFCICSRCGKSDYEVLSTQEAIDLRYQRAIEDRIHFVFLNGGE